MAMCNDGSLPSSLLAVTLIGASIMIGKKMGRFSGCSREISSFTMNADPNAHADFVRCASCGYDLRAHDERDHCPECGEAYKIERPPALWTPLRTAALVVLIAWFVTLAIGNVAAHAGWIGTAMPHKVAEWGMFWWTITAIACGLMAAGCRLVPRSPITLWLLPLLVLLLSIVAIAINKVIWVIILMSV